MTKDPETLLDMAVDRLYDKLYKAEDRIAELERREALLTAVAAQLLEVQRLWDGSEALGDIEALNDANEKLDRHIAELTAAGFPGWPEGAAETGGTR